VSLTPPGDESVVVVTIPIITANSNPTVLKTGGDRDGLAV